jgi:hypothetical protein
LVTRRRARAGWRYAELRLAPGTDASLAQERDRTQKKRATLPPTTHK